MNTMLLPLVVFLTIGGSTSGCVSVPLTEAEQIQLQHEKEDRRLVRRDELIIFLNACDAHPRLVIVEKRSIGRSPLPNERQKRQARKKFGYPYTHDNVSRKARKWNILCMDRRDVFRQLGF